MSKAQEELAAEQRAVRRKTKEDADLLQSLIAHKGWARYVELVESAGQLQMKTLREPLENTFQVTKSEYAKGTLNGLENAVKLPYLMIAEAKDAYGHTDDEEATT